MAWKEFASEMLRQSVTDRADSWSHKLAELADVWLTPEEQKQIVESELQKVGEKIGLTFSTSEKARPR